MSYLDKINSPKDLKKLTIKEKEQLAEEIRKYLLEITSSNGGHIASNLGVVELTIALLSVYDTPKDKIVWDVGHQCYVYKILTGRRDKLKTLRQLNGLSGFPKSKESDYDAFNTGHSSTSISAATGMARARDIKCNNNRVIAVIGDGALTGGMALEALNDAGSSGLDMTVILNDNEMSISKNVGGIPLLLSHLRTKKSYVKINSKIKLFFQKIPVIGKCLIYLTKKIKQVIKRIFIKNMFFEDIGFTYLGPFNGHDINVLEDILESSKKIKGPVLIHIITKKGKGYEFAENNPNKFHGIGPYDIETGETKKKKTDDYSKIFGKKLVNIAATNNRIVAITAAMTDGTGLTEFANTFPNRFFDVGITEQHAITFAAGLAKEGLIPVVSIYSSFLQRAYDQIIHDICLQNLHVVICIDRAGIVGNDGETHHGIFDLSYLSSIPNMTILAPANFKELELMLDYAVKYDGPIAIRYPRGGETAIDYKPPKVEKNKATLVASGNDLTILTIGNTLQKGIELSNKLKKKKISCDVINTRFLKPLDEKTILNSITKTKKVITIEDNLLKGGLSDAILELINKNKLNINIKSFGYDDTFVTHGSNSELEELYHLDIKNIYKETLKYLKNR